MGMCSVLLNRADDDAAQRQNHDAHPLLAVIRRACVFSCYITCPRAFRVNEGGAHALMVEVGSTALWLNLGKDVGDKLNVEPLFRFASQNFVPQSLMRMCA